MLSKGWEPHDDLAKHLPQRGTNSSPLTLVNQAIISSARRYTAIKSQVLAIFAEPKDCKPYCELDGVKAFNAQFTAQVDAFEKGNPSARVVRLPYANHLVYQSNETEVMAEMNRFMDGLSGP
jgi:hypothetical protein